MAHDNNTDWSDMEGHTRSHTMTGMQTAGLWDDVAGFADNAAGKLDETFDRSIRAIQDGDWRRLGDNLGGDFDESFNRQVEAARKGDVEGVFDEIAGGVGSFLGGAGKFLPGAAGGETVAGAIDEALGERESGSGSDFTTDPTGNYGGFDRNKVTTEKTKETTDTSGGSDDGSSRDFNRRGTPTTDGDDQSNTNTDPTDGMGIETKYIAGAVGAVGLLALLKKGSGSRSGVPVQTTRTANTNADRSNRGGR